MKEGLCLIVFVVRQDKGRRCSVSVVGNWLLRSREGKGEGGVYLESRRDGDGL